MSSKMATNQRIAQAHQVRADGSAALEEHVQMFNDIVKAKKTQRKETGTLVAVDDQAQRVDEQDENGGTFGKISHCPTALDA